MSALLQQILSFLEAWQGTLHAWGWWGLLAYAAALVVLQMGLVPLAIFAMAAGAIFGFAEGLAAVTLGTNLGAVVNFFIARHLARGAVSRYLAHHAKFRAIDAAVGREGGKIIALLRLCPVPFGLANYCYGLTAVRTWPYVLATFVGIIPGNLLFVWAGASAHEGLAAVTGGGRPRHPAEYALLGTGLVAAFGALAYITRLAKAAVARSEQAPAVLAPQETSGPV